MTNWIFLIISTLAVVSCRPQINTQDAPSPTVEVEKQELFEISTKDSTRKQLEENTKEILKKIALVNEKQGLNKKKPRPHYQHFPFSYLRSQKTDDDFKFPRDPFTNPILEYIEKGTNQRSSVTGHLNVLDKVEEENEAPPGQYIKRKLIHQQTMVVPSNLQQPQYLYNQNELEKQTVNNIRNIVENSHYTMGYNPFSVPYSYYQNQPDPYQFYNPYVSQQMTRQQWQWPLAQYFPIVIKDPLLHFFNAMTTMVEYGPNAGQADSSCSKKPQKDDKKAREVEGPRKLSYSIVNNDQGAEITVSSDDSTNSTTVVEIEDLQIADNTPQNRKSKQNQEINKTFFYNITKSPGEALNTPRIQTLQITKKEITSNDTSRQSPPIRDQILDDDELEMDEVEKAEDVQVSHDGNKKLFSKDNTGSGIFVHKIKVRKGGVAIAGPGGIATAGSGGTAIVGPHGWAYTHPDSLAIAGSGTKVVAVEPTINLAQVINEHHENKNRTRGQNKTPSRFGKVVAVGPVIYYNKG